MVGGELLDVESGKVVPQLIEALRADADREGVGGGVGGAAREARGIEDFAPAFSRELLDRPLKGAFPVWQMKNRVAR